MRCARIVWCFMGGQFIHLSSPLIHIESPENSSLNGTHTHTRTRAHPNGIGAARFECVSLFRDIYSVSNKARISTNQSATRRKTSETMSRISFCSCSLVLAKDLQLFAEKECFRLALQAINQRKIAFNIKYV